MAVSVELQRLTELHRILNHVPRGAQKTLEITGKDFSRSMPGWIAEEVVKEYNIGKQQITSQKIGTIHTIGSGIDRSIIFKGRALTPRSFDMKPKKPKGFQTVGNQRVGKKKVRKTYKITWEVKRGHRVEAKGDYNTPWFLAPAKKGSSTMIPFQRSPGHPKGFKTVAAHRTSLPQMISHDGHTLKPEIANVVWPKLEDKLHQNAQRFIFR